MKTFLFLSLFISGSAFSQTNVIAAKSHASAQVVDNNDLDNFGEPGPMRFIAEVKYLKDDCIVEKYNVEWSDHDTEYDTICDHPFLQAGTIDIDRIKAMYPEETIFKRFDKIDLNTKKSRKELREERKEKRSKGSSGILLIIIGSGLFLIYLFTPKMNPSRY